MMNGPSDYLNQGPSNAAHCDQPDPDAIKMFIGQIPKAWTESQVRDLLEVYGPIFQLNILREKGSVLSKGCCFVTFYTRKAALDAQNALHNIKTLPGMHHCVQMKPADSENKCEDRKLFVGMISKKLTEHDVRMMFSQFGNVEECRVLVSAEGMSKGCAFVTFSKRISAHNAMRHMHQSTTMEGCSAPIVVKIADSPKDKERKKMQSQMAQQLNQFSNQFKNLAGIAALFASCSISPNTPGMNHHPPSTLTPSQIQQALATALCSNSLPTSNNMPSPCPVSNSYGMPFSSNLSSSPSPFPSAGVTNGGCSRTGSNALDQVSLALTSHSNSEMGLDIIQTPPPTLNGPHHPGSLLSNMASLTSPSYSLDQQPYSAAGSHKEGPEGSNLFIYHLPTHFTDHDLLQLFLPFGSVVSAKVFIDKQTNLSKCFGFVSYSNALSAQHAIQAMHGYQIAMKRLKVQLKRPKVDGKAY